VAVPQIVQLHYQDGVIDLKWVMQGITPTTPFQITITDTTTGQSTNYPATGFAARITQQLAVADAWQATVAENSGGLGPPSAAVPIITVSPQVTLVQNTGAGLYLTWNTVGTYTTYSAVLQDLGQKTQSQSVTGTSCTFDGALQPGHQYQTGVAAQTTDRVSTGPLAQVYVPILAAPTVTLVQNTGTGLLLRWQAVGSYTKYPCTLQAQGGQPTTQVATGIQYTFAGALTAASYQTWVAAQSDDGVLVGPPSMVYAPILQAPAMTTVENTGAGLKLAWQQVGSYGRYVAVLQQLGHQSQTQEVSGLTWTFDGTLSGAGYSTDVSAQSNDGVLIGPPSAVYAPILATPSWTELDYVTGTLAATWQQVTDPSVTGYVVQVTPAGGSPSPYPAGNVDHLDISTTLTPANYAVVVRATNGIVLGPWSAPLVPLTAPPAAMSLGFDGTHLRASWQPSGQSGVTGYVVQLLADGQVSETLTPSAPPQPFVSGLTTAIVYTSQARSVGAKVKGPWCAPATGPYLAGLTYTFDGFGRLRAVAWTGAQTQSYAVDVAGNIQSVTFAPTAGGE